MDDERVLQRWMAVEMQRLHGSLVAAPRYLSELLAEAGPAAPTRDGAVHVFDRGALASLAARLSPLTRAELRLPMTFHLPHEDPGDCFAADPATIRALLESREVATTPRDGKLWMGTPLARDLARRYPTLVQFVVA